MKIGDAAIITDHLNLTNKPLEGVVAFDDKFILNSDAKDMFSLSDIYD